MPREIRHPTQRPTVQVTYFPNSTIVIQTAGSINRTDILQSIHYVWATSENVELSGSGGAAGDVFVIKPSTSCKLVVQEFSDLDRIDLTAFSQYSDYSQLNVTWGSVIITLPNTQIVRLVNVNPPDISNKHFMFYSGGSDGSTTDDPVDESVDAKVKSYQQLIIVGAVFGLAFLMCLVGWGKKYKERASELRAKKAALKMIEDQKKKPLVITIKHSIIPRGRGRRKVSRLVSVRSFFSDSDEDNDVNDDDDVEGTSESDDDDDEDQSDLGTPEDSEVDTLESAFDYQPGSSDRPSSPQQLLHEPVTEFTRSSNVWACTSDYLNEEEDEGAKQVSHKTAAEAAMSGNHIWDYAEYYYVNGMPQHTDNHYGDHYQSYPAAPHEMNDAPDFLHMAPASKTAEREQLQKQQWMPVRIVSADDESVPSNFVISYDENEDNL